MVKTSQIIILVIFRIHPTNQNKVIFFFFFFLGPYLQHMEFPKPGIEWDLWLPA